MQKQEKVISIRVLSKKVRSIPVSSFGKRSRHPDLRNLHRTKHTTSSGKTEGKARYDCHSSTGFLCRFLLAWAAEQKADCVLFPVSVFRVGPQGGPRSPFDGATTGTSAGYLEEEEARAGSGALSQGTFVVWRDEKG